MELLDLAGKLIIMAGTSNSSATIRFVLDGEVIELADVDLIFEILGNYERLEYTACYCSIFDECWTTSDSTFGVAEPVESCPSSEDSFTE